MNAALTSVLLLAIVSAGVVGLAGLAAMKLARRRSFARSVAIAALTPMLAVVVAVLVNVRAMFISTHDSHVVLVTIGCSAVLAVALSVMLGRRVSRSSRLLTEQVRSLGVAYDAPTAVRGGAPAAGTTAELIGLAGELDATRARLAESRRREQALETSRRELVAFMSHDLRTPLAGLRALAEGLEDGVIEDTGAALSRMRQMVDRMTGLVSDLFELSRLTSGTPSRRIGSVSVAELVDDIAAQIRDQARTRSVDIDVVTPGDGDRLAVVGDPDELTRALSNLVTNAVRHTAPGGAVRITADRGPDGRVRTVVADACGGIPEQDLPRLFDVGWRGSADRTPQDGGAGLGLAIARGVVHAHDGTIEVANVGAGCEFAVALPATPSP